MSITFDSFTVLYLILLAVLAVYTVMSLRNRYSMLQKRGSRVILACAFVNISYFLVYLTTDDTLAQILFAVYFTGVAWFLREVFWYEAQLAEFSAVQNRVCHFVSWVVVAIDAIVTAINFITDGAVTFCHFRWSGSWHFSFVIRPQFYVHLFLCYAFILLSAWVCVLKIRSVASLYRRRFYVQLLMLAAILVIEIYFDFFARLDMANLCAMAFCIFAFRTYWEVYRSVPNYQSYIDHFLIDRLEAGMVMFNYADRLESFNRRAAQWFGLDDTMHGRLTREAFIRKNGFPVTSDMKDQEFRFCHGEYYIDGRLEVLREGSIITGYFFVFYDVTREENNRISLENYGKNRKNFIMNVTHELRTPLNAIIGFSSQLLEGEAVGDIRGRMEFIDKSGRLILRYIDEMKDMMTLEDGEYIIQNDNFRPVDTINRIIAGSIPSEADSRVAFQHHLDPMTPTLLFGDSESVISVVGAILDNAVTFTQAGKITMTTSWQPGELGSGVLEVRVEDTGCGMSEEVQENIYLAFSVGQELCHKHENGIGVGLFIAKRILDLMGGQIVVDSRLREGTTVTVSMPFTVVDPTPTATTRRMESLTDCRLSCAGAGILIVEDDPVGARSLRRQLEHFGARTHICDSGESALEYLATGPSLDIIFMDFLMPGLNGIETTSRIRLSGVAIRKVPIIGVSADAQEGRRKQFLEAGMNDVLFKPFEMYQLADILARWLPPEKLVLTKKPLPAGEQREVS